MDISKTFRERNTITSAKIWKFSFRNRFDYIRKVQSTDVNGEYLKNGQESLISKTPKNPKIDLFNY
jgi:hypothetical protein